LLNCDRQLHTACVRGNLRSQVVALKELFRTVQTHLFVTHAAELKEIPCENKLYAAESTARLPAQQPNLHVHPVE
jgi:hypothetical protein